MKTCDCPGCNLVAIYRPVLMLPPKPPIPWKGNEAQAMLDAGMCHLHWLDADGKPLGADAFLTDETWEKIQETFRQAGLHEAERSLAWIRWIAYEELQTTTVAPE